MPSTCLSSEPVFLFLPHVPNALFYSFFGLCSLQKFSKYLGKISEVWYSFVRDMRLSPKSWHLYDSMKTRGLIAVAIGFWRLGIRIFNKIGEQCLISRLPLTSCYQDNRTISLILWTPIAPFLSKNNFIILSHLFLRVWRWKWILGDICEILTSELRCCWFRVHCSQCFCLLGHLNFNYFGQNLGQPIYLWSLRYLVHLASS